MKFIGHPEIYWCKRCGTLKEDHGITSTTELLKHVGNLIGVFDDIAYAIGKPNWDKRSHATTKGR
jgi:hypothetical protein